MLLFKETQILQIKSIDNKGLEGHSSYCILSVRKYKAKEIQDNSKLSKNKSFFWGGVFFHFHLKKKILALYNASQ